MSNYIKGRRVENYIRDKLEREGYVVVRCAGSKPVDLIAFKDGCKPMMIEVKSGKSFSKGKLREQLDLARRAGCDLFLVRKGEDGRYEMVRVG